MARGEVVNTYADASGIWHAEVEAAEGCGEQEVYGCTLRTVKNRAAKAIHAEIAARQGATPPVPRVANLGLRMRGSGWIALFREKGD